MENKTNCWEYFRCEEQQCPAFKSNTKECWLISGTRCHDKTQGDFIEKITLCIDCGFLQHNLDVDTIEDTLKVVNGQYKKFKKMFEQRQETDQQLLETISGEIAIRKQAEKSAITSEENFKTLVKSIPGIVYKGFDDWTVEFVDDNVNALTGYAADLFNS